MQNHVSLVFIEIKFKTNCLQLNYVKNKTTFLTPHSPSKILHRNLCPDFSIMFY